MRSTRHSRSRPIVDPLKGAAWLATVMLHLLAAWAITRPRPEDTGTAGPALQLVYIELPPPSPAAAPANAPLAASHHTAPTKPRPVTTAAATAQPASDATTTLHTTVDDDRWSMPAVASGSSDDGISFERNRLTTRYNPIPPSPPERIRMRRQPSLADVLRAAAQMLLWPPGYSDDPCDGLAEAAQALNGASSEGKRALLEDVVRQQSQYCRRNS